MKDRYTPHLGTMAQSVEVVLDGYLDPIGAGIGFMMPIFVRNERHWVQKSAGTVIDRFEPVCIHNDPGFHRTPSLALKVKVGHPLFYVVRMPDDRIFVGSEQSVAEELRAMAPNLTRGSALAEEVDEFLADVMAKHQGTNKHDESALMRPLRLDYRRKRKHADTENNDLRLKI